MSVVVVSAEIESELVTLPPDERAEYCEDLVACGSFAQARAVGKLRTEGKDYVVQDGDVMEFKTYV